MGGVHACAAPARLASPTTCRLSAEATSQQLVRSPDGAVHGSGSVAALKSASQPSQLGLLIALLVGGDGDLAPEWPPPNSRVASPDGAAAAPSGPPAHGERVAASASIAVDVSADVVSAPPLLMGRSLSAPTAGSTSRRPRRVP